MGMDMAARAMAKGAEQKAVKQGSTKLAVADKRIFSLPNVADGSLSVEGIKGKTLQNIAGNGFSNTEVWGSLDFTLMDAGYAKAVARSETTRYLTNRTGGGLLKPSTMYTVVLDIRRNTLNQTIRVTTSRLLPETMAEPGVTGIVKKTVRTIADFSTYTGSDYAFGINAGTGEVEFRYMILEGDWTNKEVPPYFEGIQSVGEDTGKLTVKSTGKNLINMNDLVKWQNGLDFANARNHKMIITPEGYLKIHPAGMYNNAQIPFPMSFKSKTRYQIKYKGRMETEISGIGNDVGTSGFYFMYSDNTKSGIPIKNSIEWQEISIISNSDKEVIGIVDHYSQSGYKLLKDIEFKEITNTGEFEPYKESKIEIPLTEPLRSLPNGVSDEIKDGKIIRRVGKRVLNGSESWNSAFQGNGYLYVYSTVIDSDYKFVSMNEKNLLSTHFKISDYGYLSSALAGEESFGHGDVESATSQLRFSTKKANDTASWKTWLTENNITVYYELKTPIETPITIPTINSFTNGMVTIENNIWPSELTVSYSTNVVARVINAESTLSGVLASTLTLADKELAMKSLTTLATGATLTDAVNKVNQILNIWR